MAYFIFWWRCPLGHRLARVEHEFTRCSWRNSAAQYVMMALALAVFGHADAVAQEQSRKEDLGPMTEQFCFDIDKVELKGRKFMPKSVTEPLIALYEGQCLGIQSISKLQTTLANRYTEKGYIAARVYIPEQDLTSRTLILEVVESEVEDIYWNGSTTEGRGFVATSFAGLRGKPVQLKSIEQGIRQMARLPSYEVNSFLSPGRNEGGSIINITAKRKKSPFSGAVTLRNTNANKNAPIAHQLYLSGEGLLGLSDVLSFTADANGAKAFKLGKRPMERTYTLTGSLPVGYSLFTLTLSDFAYKDSFAALGRINVDTFGKTRTQTFDAERSFYGKKGRKTVASFKLEKQNARNWLDIIPGDPTLLPAQTRTLVTARVGLSFSAPTQTGSYALNLGVKKTLRALGATDYKDVSVSDFDMGAPLFEFGGSYQRGFDLGAQKVTWSSTVSGQYSRDKIVNAHWFSLGGLSSVRGTLQSLASGISGFSVQNELSMPLLKAKTPQSIGLTGFIAVDYGEVFAQPRHEVEAASALGATIGLRAQNDKMSFSMSYSKLSKLTGAAVAQEDKGVLALQVRVNF